MISPDLRFSSRIGSPRDAPPRRVGKRYARSVRRTRPVAKGRGGSPRRRFKGRPAGDDTSHATAPPLSAARGGRQSRLLHSWTECSDRRAPGETESAICVQRLDDSLNSAIHTRYRSLLRSSSMHEPRGPPLEVVLPFLRRTTKADVTE